MVESGELRKNLSGRARVSEARDSRALNDVKGPCMIMAGNGMCTGGRIIHHLRHNLPMPETRGTDCWFPIARSLGRQLVDGAKSSQDLWRREFR